MHQPGAAGGLESAAGGVFEGSLHRCGREHCRDRRAVQAGHRVILQRDLGLCAADRELGQHTRSVVLGEPAGQRRQPQ